MAINHDQLFKELLTTFFVEFLDLFFPAVVEYLDPDRFLLLIRNYLPISLHSDTVFAINCRLETAGANP